MSAKTTPTDDFRRERHTLEVMEVQQCLFDLVQMIGKHAPIEIAFSAEVRGIVGDTMLRLALIDDALVRCDKPDEPSRLHEVTGVAIDTLATMTEELDVAMVGVDALAASAKVGTLEEIAERRAAVTVRLGVTRHFAARLIEALKSAREE